MQDGFVFIDEYIGNNKFSVVKLNTILQCFFGVKLCIISVQWWASFKFSNIN